jgi:hypothetical protein
MRRSARFLVGSFVAAVALFVAPRVASAQTYTQGGEYYGSGGAAMHQSRGPKLDVGTTLVLPLRAGGPYGGGLTLDGRYDIRLGPTVVSPGVRLAGYGIAERAVGLAMAMTRLTLPTGAVAPFLVGGVGFGGLTNDPEWGAGLLGGGGIMVYFGKGVAFGLELTYQTITGSELSSVMFMPSISFGG